MNGYRLAYVAAAVCCAAGLVLQAGGSGRMAGIVPTGALFILFTTLAVRSTLRH